MSSTSSTARSRERTLRVAWILSAWAPFTSGAAFWIGGTAVLLGDFLRRTSEFIGVFVSWLVVRRNMSDPGDRIASSSSSDSNRVAHSDGLTGSANPSSPGDRGSSDDPSSTGDLTRSGGQAKSDDRVVSDHSSDHGLPYLSPASRRREGIASLVTAAAMIISAFVIAARAVGQVLSPVQAGDLSLGLFVASAGALVNSAFWRRFRRLANERSTPVVEAQWRLYRAKSATDCAVLAVLLMHKLYPHSHWPAYADSLVSVCISLLLAISGVTVMNQSIGVLSGANTTSPSRSSPE
jgi:divalent metal cation (Fe/Co/Zn/Cd) transporter